MADRACVERPPPVLVVEHDERIARPLVEQLVADGYRARLARTTEHARVLARADPPHLALLGELETPRAALELLAEIRGGPLARPGAPNLWPAGLPVIVMSPQAEQPDLLRAFDAGADDFLARPPGYLELRARLRALLLRTGAHRARRVEVGALAIDLHAHVATLHGHPLQLRHLEYELLVHLAREPQRVFAKGELLRAVWGYPTPVSTRTLDSHSSRLRRKLREQGDEQWVVNVRAVGYRLI
ncbi:MAG TPA: response regulator transcription factor [Solirubrobacteraceae bacterium]|jgi:DNA-binding response OmpR family regulator|nr:response regulator transcription factor [Solirubrobacteraceae bacterium]